MPCYTINITSVELSMRNKNLLLETLGALGFRVLENDYIIKASMRGQSISMNLETGQAELPQSAQGLFNQIKRTYAGKAIQQVAKKRRWILKQHGNKLTATKY